MVPGPELDAEIARKVLGVVVIMDTETGAYQLRDMDNKKFIPVPPYSTDTVTAHMLVSKFKAAGCLFAINADDDQLWSVTMSHPQIPGVNFTCKGQTLAHAICTSVLQFNNLFKIART